MSFKCPKCEKETLSLEKGDSISKEGISNPKVEEWLKQEMAKTKMKKYRFWRCAKCNFFYQTDLNGNLVAEIPSKEW